MCKECEKREQLLTLQREVIETLKRQLGIYPTHAKKENNRSKLCLKIIHKI